jgi:hypothetical protein
MEQVSRSEDCPGAKVLALASLTMIIALVLVVGSVSHGILRHLVQTAPSWLTVYLGFRRREMAKWTALPTYLFWLPLMMLIWGFLFGWTSILHGHFSPIEIAMTIVVAAACCIGIVKSLLIRSSASWLTGLSVSIVVLALQFGAFILSLQPGIANR